MKTHPNRLQRFKDDPRHAHTLERGQSVVVKLLPKWAVDDAGVGGGSGTSSTGLVINRGREVDWEGAEEDVVIGYGELEANSRGELFDSKGT